VFNIIATLVLLLGFPLAQPAVDLTPSPFAAQHRAAHHIFFDNVIDGASCSATAVGPHTLLTAGHCLLASNTVEIDGDKATIVKFVFDDADHMLIVTDAVFQAWLPIDQEALFSIGDAPVHIWGNPGHSLDVFRFGVFLRWNAAGDNAHLAVFQLPTFAGDSGSGVISESGRIVAVISLGNNDAEMAAFPFHFTEDQLAQIK